MKQTWRFTYIHGAHRGETHVSCQHKLPCLVAYAHANTCLIQPTWKRCIYAAFEMLASRELPMRLSWSRCRDASLLIRWPPMQKVAP